MEVTNTSGNEKERIAYWDNLKGLLIFLVVIAHFFFEFKSNIVIQTMGMFIYLFHMPAFAFVSGYFTRENINTKRIKKYILLYLVFNFFMMWFSYGIDNTRINLLEPYYSLWYILAIVAWRLIYSQIKNIKGILPLSIIVGLLVGNFPQINNVFAISRIICFFPFFILGTVFYKKKLDAIIEKKNIGLIMFSLFLLTYMVIMAYFFITKLNFDQLIMSPYIDATQIVNRMIIYVSAFIMIIVLIGIVPKKKVVYFNRIGMNSLYIFLFHRAFTIIIARVWDYRDNTLLTLLLSFGCSVLLCVILGSNIIKNVTEYVYSQLVSSNKNLRGLKIMLKGWTVIMIIITLFVPVYYDFLAGKDNIQNQENIIFSVLTDEEMNKINNSFSILFTGDLILLQEQVKKGYDVTTNTYNYDDVFEFTNEYIKEADLSIGVFEGPMAGESVGYSNSDYDDGIELHINVPDEFGNAVKHAGFDLVTLANNHIFDKGIDGAKRTVSTLNKIGLDYIGFYDENESRNNAKIIEKGNLKIGVLAYTYGFNYWSDDEFISQEYVPVIVGKDSFYFEKVKKDVLKDFEILKKENPDVIIVLPHYGTQFIHETDENQETWNKVFLDAGADIILGDHSHSVQPVEFKKNCDGEDAFIVNCPGNFANSYTYYDGDATAMVEVYLDKNNGKVLASSIIPMFVQSTRKNNYRAIPIYDALYNEKLESIISLNDFKRIEEVYEIITKSMIGETIEVSNVTKRLYYTPQGYKREKSDSVEINKNSLISKLIDESNSICFIGDSITEGSRNGGYGWYEPLINAFDRKTVYNISKGGATSKTIYELVKNNIKKCDLYVVAIGTNDIRYRDSKFCAMDENDYIDSISEIVKLLPQNSKIVFIAPWNSLDNDSVCILDVENKLEYMDRYSLKLEKYCTENNYYFINPNNIIFDTLKKESYYKYMVDYIHPNCGAGIELYSNAVQNASILDN